MVRKKKEDMSNKLLVVLTIGVLVVSLVGTWLVLQQGFAEPRVASGGKISFTKDGAQVVPVKIANPTTSGIVSFSKQ